MNENQESMQDSKDSNEKETGIEKRNKTDVEKRNRERHTERQRQEKK